MDERSEETRIAVVETQYQFIASSLTEIKTKLDKYNGVREKLDDVCKAVDEHKQNHDKPLDDHRKNHLTYAGLVIAGSSVAAALLGIVLHVLKVI